VKTIAIVNQKGGCGKTTSAINIAGLLARDGFRTLLVDLDPQSHCAAGLAIPEQRIDLDIGDAMLAGPEQVLDSSRLLWRATRNLDLAPSRMKLAGLEAARGGLADKPDKERRLSGVLGRLARNYDACLVDCSPSIGLLTYNALAAADHVLVPVETSFFSLQGASKQVNTIRTLGKRLGSVSPYWIVPTIHDGDSALARDLLDELRRRFGSRVSPVVIRRDPTLKEAASFGQPVIEYSPESPGAKDYRELAEWLIGVAGLSCTSRPRVPERLASAPDETFVEEAVPTVEVLGTQEIKMGLGRRLADGLAEPPEQPDAPPPQTSEVVAASAPAPAESAARPEGAVATLSRAEDMAQRARLMLLRRADEQLKRVVARTGLPTPPPVVVESPPAVTFELGLGERLDRESRLAGVKPLFGARETASGVLFVQPLTCGVSVAVAGDFNGWSSSSHAMRRNEALGVFELCTPLEPGRHRYRLVIDGRWTADPFNDTTEPNPFGELNSIVEVTGESKGRP
jgi:chromosome partitioning protein